MRIAIAGGSGFLGRRLSADLVQAGHRVIILTRGRANSAVSDLTGATLVAWAPDGSAGEWVAACAGADVLVNLAGESIGARRWSSAQKQRVLESRVKAARSLVAAAATLSPPPSAFISASAVGYYGSRGDEILDEAAPPGDDFLARVCVDWEREAQRAATGSTRVAVIRTGLVLDGREGALPRMLPPFKFFVGGPLGSGRQYMSWIHEQDWRRLARWCIERPGASGPFNATAPSPVTNIEFSRALGRVLHRPSWMKAPALALRIVLGEMADSLLLSSQRAVPSHALAEGFEFQHRDLARALGDVLSRHSSQ